MTYSEIERKDFQVKTSRDKERKMTKCRNIQNMKMARKYAK